MHAAEGRVDGAPGLLPASEEEREAVLTVLARAVGTGHLDLGEYDDRTRTAVHARTRAELATTLHGLPAPGTTPGTTPGTVAGVGTASRDPGTMPGDPPGGSMAWAAAGHLLGPVTSFVGPLVVFALRGRTSRFVRDQAAEAVNFQFTFLLALVALIPLTVVTLGLGGVLYAVLPVLWLVLSVVGGVMAGTGERRYRYPWALRLVR